MSISSIDPASSSHESTAPHGSATTVLVIGGGAAGLMAALHAARAGARVTLLERGTQCGRKILISGGGRCNILPAELDDRRFVTSSPPRLLRAMLRLWPLREQIAFFEHDLGLPLVEEEGTCKLFPASQRARDVRDALLRAFELADGTVRLSTFCTAVSPEANVWKVVTESEILYSDAVIVATGGLSVPSTGSDGFGLRLAAQLGMPLRPTCAALTPITSDDARFTALAGITLPVHLRAEDGARHAEASGAFLFTHRGYSGPAVLDVSHVIVRACDEGRRDARLLARWTPYGEEDWNDMLQGSGQHTVGSVLRREMPERLALLLCELAQVSAGTSLAQLRREQRRELLRLLTACPLPWNGHEGYRKAEVTDGGVDLTQVHPRSMEALQHPGLFFCGEVLDAVGPIGGYNFFWAWATGRAAGLAAAKVGSRE